MFIMLLYEEKDQIMEIIKIKSITIQNISDEEFKIICDALESLHDKMCDREGDKYVMKIEDMCQKLGIEGYEFS